MRVGRWIQAIAVTALMVSDATPDGVLDPNFGGGIVTTGFAGPVGPRPALLSSVALQADRAVAIEGAVSLADAEGFRGVAKYRAVN